MRVRLGEIDLAVGLGAVSVLIVGLAGCERRQSTIAPEPSASATAASAAPSPSAPKPDLTKPPNDCPEGMAGIPGGVSKQLDRSANGGWLSTSHPVEIRPFCMDKFEVTVERFAKCVDAGKCDEPRPFEPKGALQYYNWKHVPPRPNYPINGVRGRANAARFCEFEGRRLPDDAQWVWAARGGPNQWDYPWGNDKPDADHANLGGELFVQMCGEKFRLNCGLTTHPLSGYGAGHFYETAPVGSLPKGANPWGVQDLVGNVAEYTAGDMWPGANITRGESFATADSVRFPIRDSSSMYEKESVEKDDPAYDVGFRCGLAK